MKLCYNRDTFPGSSMVEQEAVNFEVAGSSPVPGATSKALRAFFVHQKCGPGPSVRAQSREPFFRFQIR